MTAIDDFRLTVLNPGGRDPEQDFGAGEPGRAHPPTNFHGYAAATRGVYDCTVKRTVTRSTPVLLLLRGDFKESERALAELKRAGRTVAVSLKETGLHQIADQLRKPDKLARFIRVIEAADGCIGATPEAADVYRQIRRDNAPVSFIPTPYPIEDPRWDFSRPVTERSGVLIGTREFDVPSRNHLAALIVGRNLAQLGHCVTVFNSNGRDGSKILAALEFPADKLRVIERRLSYGEWLGIVAQHKLVLQLDRSRVPGQVAGDTLLCRTLCVGGDGAVDRLAYPHTCGWHRTVAEVANLAAALLDDTGRYDEANSQARQNALNTVSVTVIRCQLHEFFTTLLDFTRS